MTNPPVATREYLAPPVTEVGVIGWLRGNLFNSWFNSLLTIAVLLLLWQLVPPFFSWAFIDSVWNSPAEARDEINASIDRFRDAPVKPRF